MNWSTATPRFATGCASCGSIFDAPRLKRELADIENKISDPSVWADASRSQPLMRERKRLETLLGDDAELARRSDDIEAYFELAREGEATEADLEREIPVLQSFAEKLESKTMLSGEMDPMNAIVTVHPGAGGTESQDWAEMLMRMYLRWAEREGFKTEINEVQDGDEAGIKSATFTISGDFAFGLLSGETYYVGHLPPIDWLQWNLSRNPLLLAGMIVALAFIGAGAAFLSLRLRARRRLR